MWSTELESNLNKMVPVIAKAPSGNEVDILNSLYDGEAQDGKELRRSILDMKDDTAEVRASIKPSEMEYIGKLPLEKSKEYPLEMTKGKSHSSQHFTDDFLLENRPERSIRMVEIVKTERDPLGFYIRQGDGITNKTGVFISRILRGSLVDCSGVIKIGDEILKVNHVDVRGLSLSDIVKLIQVPKLLILTVRTANRTQYSRPKISSRHSSPSLLSMVEKDSKKSKSKMKVKHSKTDSFNQMTANNEQKYKQRDEYVGRMNTNKPYSDLSKNTSTIDDLIRLLRAESQDLQITDSKQKDSKRLEKDSNCKTEKANVTDSVYRKQRPSNFDKLASCKSQSQIQINENTSNNRLKKASTIVPTTSVNLIFDDEETKSVIPTTSAQNVPSASSVRYPDCNFQVNKPQVNLVDVATKEESHSQQVKVDTLKVTHSRSRSSSRGSSPNGSPKTRRRLPSLPTDRETNKKKSFQIKNECSSPKMHLLIPGNADHKPHRKLPTPPASPIMKPKGAQSEYLVEEHTGSRSPNLQKENRRSQPGSSTLVTKEPNKHRHKPDDANNNKVKTSAAKTELDDEPDGCLTTQNDQKSQEFAKPSAHVSKPSPYRRSQSQYSDFFEQQRHSMFLQSYALGSIKANSETSRKSSKAHSIEYSDVPCATEDLSSTFPRKRVFSEVQKKFAHNEEKVSFKPTSGRSPGAMRRYASSSFLLSKLHSKETAATHDIKMASYPDFLLYPDDYKDDDLSCSHAVSGMMQVRVIKATSLFFSDKKQSKKISCAIEVDFERKAFTTAKKITKNPNWDEAFDIEIQHGREMTFLCSISNKEFDRTVGRASFYLKPLVRRGQIHRMVIRLKPEGLLHVELKFTELKTLLRRAPSGKQIGVFGFNLSVTSELERSSIPVIVRKCVDEIENRGIHSVGLYRISGNARRKEQLRAQFDENSTNVDISAANCPDINVITGILKDYLRELPEPLITDKMSEDLILGVQDNIQDKDPEIGRKFLSKLLSELPDTNRNTLIYILNHLCRVMNNEDNKMDCRSLSVCLAPVLQCSPKNLSQSKDLLHLKMYLKTVEVLLEMWNRLEGTE